MQEKIRNLRNLYMDIGIMINILSGEFYEKDLTGKTIKENIECYSSEGDIFKYIYDTIIKEHGDEPCPFDKNDRHFDIDI